MTGLRRLPPGLLVLALAVAGGTPRLWAVGKYLYANPENPERFKGGLTVTFMSSGRRLVIAYGRKNRKDRKVREGTTEAEREEFKPFSAKVIDAGRKAIFWHLPIDRYDLIVVQDGKDDMRIYEGIELLRGSDPALASAAFFEEIKKSLSPREDRIGGWEGFFDTKQFERFETDGSRGCVLVQQMRLGKALAGSGRVLEGCIHSVDICWLERALAEGVGWQVVNRQQLYRAELPARVFFRHRFVPELKGVRVGTRHRELGPLTLP